MDTTVLPGSQDADLSAPLVIEGFKGTPEQIEQQWFEQVYRGRGDRMKQLTVRAVLMGALIGAVMSLSNLYIGLKAGWTVSVAITACIVSYASWSFLQRIRIARSPMSILENNCMQSTASSAGYSTGSVLVSAFSAYYMIHGHPFPLGFTFGWILFVAVLGVTMAIPMKRQMINVEQLRYPEGIGTAETLRALYAKGPGAKQTARALTWAGVFSAVSAFWTDGLGVFFRRPIARFGLGGFIDRVNAVWVSPAWQGRTVIFAWDPIFIGVGALIGLRTSASIFLGGILCWCVFVPICQAHGGITATGYAQVVQWTLWGGVPCMVVAGLLSAGLQWRAFGRAFREVKKIFRGGSRVRTELDAIETPMSWFAAGQVVSIAALAWLAKAELNLPVWESLLAGALSFLLAFVCCRVNGETGVGPIGPLGKVTQLIFGALNPGNMDVNLMSACITSGTAASSADLLSDLKSGYLLGAHPRRQFLAQFYGVFVGATVSVLAYRVLVPTASYLGTAQLPAPAAQTWRVVALALSRGLSALTPLELWSIAAGCAAGILLTLAPRWFPKAAKWLPSPSALGLAWTFPWFYGLLFFVGALLGWLAEWRSPEWAKRFKFPIASGLIAGGSLMEVVIQFRQNIPVLVQQLGWHWPHF